MSGLKIYIFVFLLPALLIYSVFLVFPLFNSLQLSFFEVEGFSGAISFVGFRNFQRLFGEPLWREQFFNAIQNNVIFFLMHMIVQNPIGLLLATLLAAKRGGGRNVYRTVLFMPTMLSVVIIGFVWQLILSPVWGVAHSIMEFFGIEALFAPWLGLKQYALGTLSLISVWQFIGIPMMLFYAALIAIPHEMIQSAHVDGATGWVTFWRIKFPLILPVVGIVSILTFIGNFNAFDLIYTTQGVLAGPPNYSTDILGTFFYRTFFGQQLQLGNPTMGATIAAMMFCIILAGALAYLLWQRRVETYEF